MNTGQMFISVADPGFPVGGVDPLGGNGPLTPVPFSKNVCENRRIGSHRGTCPAHCCEVTISKLLNMQGVTNTGITSGHYQT